MKFRTVENDPNPSLERGKRDECLATFWQQATPGTSYWRCLVPARYLPGQSFPFRPDDLREKDGTPYLPRQRGAAVWQFLGDDLRARIALGQRQLHDTWTVMEVDDNYLRAAPYMNGRQGSPWAKTRAEAYAAGRNGYSHEMHRLLVPYMDGVVTATEFLADRYVDFNENVHVCPNSVDPDDWDFPREEHDTFRIVYYGSPSHVVDSPLVTKALKWASRQPGVTVHTVGFQNPAWTFPHEVIPWNPDLVEARKHLFRFDLGIAPLKSNEWANGKSDVKALEYAMAGVMPLVSRAEPFRPWWDMPPFLVDDEGWEGAIRWAVQNQDDVRYWAEKAKDYVLDKRTIQANIHRWREAITP